MFAEEKISCFNYIRKQQSATVIAWVQFVLSKEVKLLPKNNVDIWMQPRT